MQPSSNEDSPVILDLLRRAGAGDRAALGELLALYEPRLRLVIDLRLDRRVQGRLDPSDVLQETFLEAAMRFDDYLRDRPMPVFLWLRFLTVQKVHLLHRQHLGVQARDAGREVSLDQTFLPEASSHILAEQLAAGQSTPSQQAMKAEMQQRLQQALEVMDPLDREVLVLRHFEQLSNVETARVLGVGEAAASRRYTRALGRLKDILAGGMDASGAAAP